jgi:hypothetical protein
MKHAIRSMTAMGAAACAGVLVLASAQPASEAAVQLPIPLIPCGDTAELIHFIGLGNQAGGPSQIYLSKNCVYTLTAVNGTDDHGSDALPSITGDITINGQGSTIARSSSASFRIFAVQAGGSLGLRGLTISNGVSTEFPGGGIADFGHLALTDTTLAANTSDQGGGLYVSPGATAQISGGAFAVNTATSAGGAIANDGTVIVTGTSISGNFAAGQGGGIQNNGGGKVALDHVSITHNAASSGGGGISNFEGGTAVVTHSAIISNVAAAGAGGISNAAGTVTDNGSTVQGNTPTDCLGSPTTIPGCSS